MGERKIMNDEINSNTSEEIPPKIKISLTIFFGLIIIALSVYLFSCHEIIIETKYIDTSIETLHIEDIHRRVDFIYLAQFGIVALLVSIIWMWRLKFGITGFAGIQGESPKITPYSYDQKATDDTKQTASNSSTQRAKKVASTSTTDSIVANIQELLNRYSALSSTKIAAMLNLSTQTVSKTIMQHPDLFRKNGYGPKTTITNAKSNENTVLDNFSVKYIFDPIIEDIRPARINEVVVDAIMKTKKDIYLFEIKRILDVRTASIAINHLRHIAAKFSNLSSHIVVIILEDPSDTELFNLSKETLLSKFSESRSDIVILQKNEIEKDSIN